jgi:hypothetical protein
VKGNKFPHAGEEIEIFQVIPGKLAGQDMGLLVGRAEIVDDNQIPPQGFASAAEDGKLIIGEGFIPDFNIQLTGQVFQLVQKNFGSEWSCLFFLRIEHREDYREK